MRQMNIHLFGKIELSFGGQTVTGLPIKSEELLCFLLLNPQRQFTREYVAHCLWEKASTNQGKKYLRDAIWRLQNAIAEQTGFELADLIHLDAEWISIQRGEQIWVDCWAVEHTFQQVKGVGGVSLTADQAHQIEATLAQYRGPLMEGWYQDWCMIERERQQLFYLSLLDKLVDYYEARHDHDHALSLAYKILKHDWARERTHRKLMRLHHQMGNRTAALSQYARLTEVLEKEFQILPDAKTEALYLEIVSGKTAAEAPPKSLPLKSLPKLLSLIPNLIEELKLIHQALETRNPPAG